MARIFNIRIKERVLAAAIAISLGWHLLWLSAIKITSASSSEPHKFSKVSFLGPISSRPIIEARNAMDGLTFLEDRYLRGLWNSASSVSAEAAKSISSVADGRDVERHISDLAERSLEGEKLTPEPER